MSSPTPLDPRVTPARPDLAASRLRGQVAAERFVDGEPRVVIDPVVPVRREPRPDASLETEALLGEGVTVYEFDQEGWAWGQLDRDGYVGWLPAAALGAPGVGATHRVSAPRTLVFPGPSIKLPPLATLPLGAQFAALRHQPPFMVTRLGYVPDVHVAPLDIRAPDFVAVAAQFLGTPYLWGGKTALGIDCSGLVQTALTACGVACPRDSDMQARALGVAIDASAPSSWGRGDLVFWKGHVAIVRDPATLLHANAFHMAVALEPLAAALTRIAAAGSPVTSVRRLELSGGAQAR